MSNKKYMVETVKWNEEEGDFEDEEQFWDLTGIQAMQKILEFMASHPNAREADIETEPDDGMFISLVDQKENGDQEWLDAYCRNNDF